MKRYFIRQIGILDSVKQVSQEEYARLASSQFLTRDAETLERILESATLGNKVVGTTHMFWTEES